MKTVQEVSKAVNERGIEFFLCSFVEMSGAPRQKSFPRAILRTWHRGARALLALPPGTLAKVRTTLI